MSAADRYSMNKPMTTTAAMIKFYFCMLIAFLSAITLSAQTPTLGTYPNTTVVAGQSTTVTPSAAPTNTVWMVVSSSTSFNGVLTANVSTGVVRITDAMHAGVYTINVKAAQPFGSASTSFILTVTNPTCSQGLFRSGGNMTVAGGPHSAAVGDFNNDGIQDMASANGGFNSVSVRIGNGTGGFTGTTDLPTGTTRYLAIGDVNCDGNQDIINSNVITASLSVHLGNGAGGFSAPTSVSVSAFPTGVAIGDFNNDGFKDIAAGTSGNIVSIRLGDGTGNFSGTGTITAPASAAWSIAIGDFNEDGNQDLAITSGATVAIRLGDGAGGFTGSTNVPVGVNSQTVVIADFNNDGNQDLAVTCQNTGVSVRLGDGLGGFSGTTELAIGTSMSGLAAGDFNGDGNTDLATNRFSGMMYIRYGDGLGGFTGTTSFSAFVSSIRTIAVGDFNNDGYEDFGTASESGGFIVLFLGGAAEINITGNANTIPDGDATPSVTDNTHFGSSCGTGTVSKTFLLQNTGTTNLTLTNVTITGPDAADFAMTMAPATTTGPGGSSAFIIQFTPGAAGIRNATVNIFSPDCDEPIYDFAISAVSATPVVATPSHTNVTCFGNNNGTATVSATGGSGPYSYNWSPGNPTGDGTSTITGLTPSAWSVVVIDVNGCSATQTYSITQPAAVSGSTVVTHVNCFGESTGTINLTPSGGTGAYTYSWSPGGQTSEDRANVAQGTYTVTITDGNGCTATVTATVTQPPTPVSGTTTVTHVACFGGSTGSIDLTPAGGVGPYIYQWLPMGPYTEDRSGIIAGTYTVWVVDSRGCFGSVTTTVTQPSAAITANISSTPRSCATANGTATVSGVAGGTPGYSYSWSPSGGTSSVATGLAAGGYTCTITDNSGCTITRTVTVASTPSPSLALSAFSNVNCFGGNTGIIGVAPAFGGTAPYSYDWTPGTPVGDGTRQINDLIAGTYTCTVTDANGCTGTYTHIVTQPSSPLTGTTTVTNITCFGGSNGAINLTPSGGTGPYTFNWLPSGPTTEDRTGLAQGTYSVQITDSRACTTTITVSVTQPSAVIGSTTVTNVSCNGGSNGAIDLTPTGGTGPYTYFWAPTFTSEDRLALTTGTYTVQITDVNGCTGTASAIVTEPTPIAYTFATTDVTCNGDNTGSATISSSGGNAPYTYAWSTGGLGQTETSLSAGTYSFIITDANMCTTAAVPVTITQPPALAYVASQTNVTCFGSPTGTASVVVTGGAEPYDYVWNTNQTGPYEYSMTDGNYWVVITDANGCTATATFLITSPAALVATATSTDATCNGGANGTGTVNVSGGTTPYTYAWSNGGTASTVSGLSAGTYSVVITDANGCTSTRFIWITEPTAITNVLSQTDVSCTGGNNGTATATVSGGTAPYTYAWSSGGTAATETGLAAGIYSVDISDANSCSMSTTFTIAEPTALGLIVMRTNVNCNGGNTGDATAIALGGTSPYTYLWSSGGTGSVENGLAAGTYSVLVTDGNSCTSTATVTITEPVAITVSSTQTDVSCNGGNNGSATVAVSGGVTPYTYAWSSGGTAATESGLTAGTYSVLVTDANSCTSTFTVAIAEPDAITWTITQTDVTCWSGNDATATVTVSGGTGAYAYLWPSGSTTPTETTLGMGTYAVLITDANSCTATATVIITEPDMMVAELSDDDVACHGGNSGSATVVDVTGGTAPYTYAWSSGGTAATEAGLAAGTYTVIITDANGCTITETVIINEPAVLTAAVVSAVSPSTCGGTDGSIDITVSGGDPYYYFLWSTSAVTEDLTALAAGTYTVTVTDMNGCTTTLMSTINDPGAPAVTLTLPMDTACGSFPGTVLLSGETPAGGTWSGNNVSGNTFDPFTAGVGMHFIAYTFTDINGCTASATDSVYVDLCMGIETVTATSWNLFPNPTSGLVNLTTTGETGGDVIVEVYSAEGKLIRSENKQQATIITLDLTAEPVGTYFIKIIVNEEVSVKRVVKM